MKRAWMAAILVVFMSGCTTFPTWIKDDIKDYVQDRLDDAKKEIVKSAEAKVTEFVDAKIDELDKKAAEANEKVAKELGIDTASFDIDKDGELQPNEQIALAQAIAVKGRAQGWSWGTILTVIILVVFMSDAKKAVAAIKQKIFHGNGGSK